MAATDVLLSLPEVSSPRSGDTPRIPPSILLSAGGGDNFQRFSGAGWRRAYESASSNPVGSHPTACLPATLAGAGRKNQVPRTRSHRLTHQPDRPHAAAHRARDPVRPCRRVGPTAV